MDRQTKRSSIAPKLVLEPVRESSRMESHPLAVGRYLMGSAPDCDIVIDVGGIAPQHCLMIVGANKTIVKAISPLTWINDGPLTEAVLKHGERLILGPVELRTRLPEVSEWLDVQEPELAPIPVATSIEHAQIEELLDHARQQLQIVVEETCSPADQWSEDLPLSDAVQQHAAGAVFDRQEQAVAIDERDALNRELQAIEARESELVERARAIENRGSELSSREEHLYQRERELTEREAQWQALLAEVEHQRQARQSQEQALQVQISSVEEMQLHLDVCAQALANEEARVQQLVVMIEQKLPEIQAQAAALHERTEKIEVRELDLEAKEEELHKQSGTIQALAAMPPLDTTDLEQREVAIARREAVLASSMSALQSSRDQITREASQLEQRFAELIEREQAVQQKTLSIAEQTRQIEVDHQSLAALRSVLDQREQAMAALAEDISSREAKLLKQNADVESRDQRLSTLRSELDIREESLNQQFSQLQLDRSTLRASQSRHQLLEQESMQRVAALEATFQQRSSEVECELDRRNAELEARLTAEWDAKSQEVHNQLVDLEAQRQRLVEQEQSLAETRRLLEFREEEVTASQVRIEQERSQISAAVEEAVAVKTAELEQQWAQLAQERAEFSMDQQELAATRQEWNAQVAQWEADKQQVAVSLVAVPDVTEEQWQVLRDEEQRLAAERDALSRDRSELEAARLALRESEERTAEVGGHMQAVLDERETLEQLRAEVEREHQALRMELEGVQRSRLQYETDHNQLMALKAESESERDIYLLERQTIIADRQALQDRERLVKKHEAEIEQLRADVVKTSNELEFLRKQFDNQKKNLEVEWDTLRQERAELELAATALETQREELMTLAEQLEHSPVDADMYRPIVMDDPQPDSLVQAAIDSEVQESGDKWDIVEADPTDDQGLNEFVDETEALSESDDELPVEEENDALAGFANFSSIGKSRDELLPPEIAEIIRRAGGQSEQVNAVESSKVMAQESSEVVASVVTRPAPVLVSPQTISESKIVSVTRESSETEEERRLNELLGRNSGAVAEDMLNAATREHETYSSVMPDLNENHQAEWDQVTTEEVYELPVDVILDPASVSDTDEGLTSEPQTLRSTERVEQELPEDENSQALRSRLSEMFGINLGHKSPPDGFSERSSEVMDTSLRSESSEENVVDDDLNSPGFDTDECSAVDAESMDGDVICQEEEETAEEEPVSEATEPLDPVAAYMEQLLARTRKTKEHSAMKAVPVAPKPKPDPATSVVIEEVRPVAVAVPGPQSQRPTRKQDPVDKDAIRANLDSFRTIANTRARSDLARSEIRRLILTVKVKEVFLFISIGLALILMSTEFWTTRRYRIEMVAALLTTAFLGYDYFRTQKRMKELSAVAHLELDVEAEELTSQADGE